MAKKKIPYRKVGTTPDGKMVMAGVHYWSATYGLPLVDVLVQMESHSMVPDWIDYYETSISSGMASDRILKRIREAVTEVYGSDYCDAVLKRFDLYLTKEQ